ncbi:hypothetical protein HWV62_8407 [Athelia sp. TMB]|nr:hypothetical protein HWV62_8407 [Athelia sp. TMB]
MLPKASLYPFSMSFALRSLRSSHSRLVFAARQLHSTPRRAEQFLNATPEVFNKVALNETAKDRVVLVDFYADWCNPCKMLSPILEGIAADPASKTGSGASIDLVTIDVDVQHELSGSYSVSGPPRTIHTISSLPTVVAFKGGKKIDQFVGALNPAGVKKFLEKL